MNIRNLVKILGRLRFFHKRESYAHFYRAVGVLLLFSAIGAFWMLASTLARSNFLSIGDTFFSRGIIPAYDDRIIGEAFVQFDFGTKTSRAFRGSVVDNMTISDALEQAALAGNFKISWRPIPTIDGARDGIDGKYWRFYKNNARIAEPLESFTVDPGDEIFARFE